MRIIIIGGVAAGTTAATNARRVDDKAEIVLYEKDSYLSYSTCSMPYYIGGDVASLSELAPRDPKFFEDNYRIEVKVMSEVTHIDTEEKVITVQKVSTKEVYTDHYDKLILATGANVFVPEMVGFNLKHVFTLRRLKDARDIRDYIVTNHPKSAVIIGSSYIALEMVENLMKQGMKITIVERHGQILPKMDPEMAALVEEVLIDQNVTILKGCKIREVRDKEVLCEDGTRVEAQMVLVCTGIKPNTYLAKEAGISLEDNDAIQVDHHMRTSEVDIYACGDCINVESPLFKKSFYHPIATVANKTGQIAGENAAGKDSSYIGCVGTSIFGCFEYTIGLTGLTEKEATKMEREFRVIKHEKIDKSSIFQGEKMVIKALVDNDTNQLIGAQIIGKSGVDKRLDLFATLIQLKVDIDTAAQLDLSYAPPYATVRDPIHYTALLLQK